MTTYLTNQQCKHKNTGYPINSHKHVFQFISWCRVVTNRCRCFGSQIETTNIPGIQPVDTFILPFVYIEHIQSVETFVLPFVCIVHIQPVYTFTYHSFVSYIYNQ